MKLLSLKRKSLSLSLLIGFAFFMSMNEYSLAASQQTEVKPVNVNTEIEKIVKEIEQTLHDCIFNFSGKSANKLFSGFAKELILRLEKLTQLLEVSTQHPMKNKIGKAKAFIAELKSICTKEAPSSVVSKILLKYSDLLPEDARKRLISKGPIKILSGLKKRLAIRPVSTTDAQPVNQDNTSSANDEIEKEETESKINQIVGYLALALEYAKMYNPFAKS